MICPSEEEKDDFKQEINVVHKPESLDFDAE